MSDIYGTGFGSNHDWERGYTPQVGSYGTKYTRYICRKCGAAFTHYYDETPDIFEAIKQYGVKEKCEATAQAAEGEGE